MDTLEGGVAHQGPLLRVTGVVEGQGAEKRDCVTHNQCYNQEFENCLSQVDLKREKWASRLNDNMEFKKN